MLERYERIVKWVCFALAALLVLQISRVALRANPLKNVAVPSLPHLDAKPDSASDAKLSSSGAGGRDAKNGESHSPEHSASNATNNIEAKTKDAKATGTNAVVVPLTRTNSSMDSTVAVSTNSSVVKTTNSESSTVISKTNAPKVESSGMAAGTAMKSGRVSSRNGGPSKPNDLPPTIQARVDRITESEILAPVVRPMPAALMGIAGDHVFLRSSSGQTGMVKEGDELGGMKLLRIGTNRVLVEEAGEKKELMIFAGMGGESLQPKDKKDQ